MHRNLAETLVSVPLESFLALGNEQKNKTRTTKSTSNLETRGKSHNSYLIFGLTAVSGRLDIVAWSCCSGDSCSGM